MEQTYDIRKTYEENYALGPQFELSPRSTPSVGKPATFLGRQLKSRIGIAAGLLLNSRWIAGYAERGFDILTYKTVRSSHRPCYPPPNWVFVNEERDATSGEVRFVVIDDPGPEPADVSSSVCFGMPSMAPEVWREDVTRAKESLGDGQMLIVSVVATPRDGWNRDDLAGDFLQCAKWAADAGADAIEANFSCPNVCSAEGSIYLDPSLSGFVAGAIRDAIGSVPLLIKTGAFPERRQLTAYLRALDGTADAVTMVNCLIRPVVNRDGSPAFGPDFREAGVLGRAIHDPCVECVRDARTVIDAERLDLVIAAVGGVATSEDMLRYLDAGASAVLLGSSPMYLPDIAAHLRHL